MNNEEYLSQIASNVRPESKTAPGFLSSKYFKLITGALLALIAIIIVGNLLGSGGSDLRNSSYGLQYRIKNTMSVISEYQPKVKSSTLRSASASLYGILSNTENELSSYLKEKYNLDDQDTISKLKEEANLEKDELESELFNAKINGILDRIYAHKMAYEISVIATTISNLYSQTKDDTYKVLLDKSLGSLNNIYSNFTSFTEGNK